MYVIRCLHFIIQGVVQVTTVSIPIQVVVNVNLALKEPTMRWTMLNHASLVKRDLLHHKKEAQLVEIVTKVGHLYKILIMIKR